MDKVRLLRKTPPQYSCPSCNSKKTIAAHLCGKWPVEEFKELSPEEQVAFWNSCVSNKWEMMKAIEKHLVRRVVNQRLNAVEGKFLPLSVWAAKGFDAALIEATCPQEMHPNLGPTFQVKIHSTCEKAIEESVREHMAKLIQTRKKKSDKGDGEREGLWCGWVCGRPVPRARGDGRDQEGQKEETQEEQ